MKTIDTSPTLENLLESKKQILETLGNPYCDFHMIQHLNDKLKATQNKIDELKKGTC